MTADDLDRLLARAFRAWQVPLWQRDEMTDEWTDRFARHPADVLTRALDRAEEQYPDRMPTPIQLARIVKAISGEGHGAYQPARPPRDEPLTPERAAAEARYWREQERAATTDQERAAARRMADHFDLLRAGGDVAPIPLSELLKVFGVQAAARSVAGDAERRDAERKAQLREQARRLDADGGDAA